MTEPTTRKVNAHTNLGTLQQGDVVLGERTSGTTGLFTVPDLSAGGAVDSVNGETGVVVLTSDDISTTAQTNKFVTAADITNLSNLSGVNTGDQTTIVGITGTKAEFDTAVTDGDFLYVGDVTQYTDEMAQDAVGGMVDTSLTYVDGTPLLQRAALTGDVTASAGSNATTIANDAVTYAKMQNVSATDKLLGRSTSGSGDVEEITCTAAGRAILDDLDAAAQRTTLGLGTLATQSGTFSGTSSGTNTGDQTSIVGITGTKAQFNTAVSDGDIVYTDSLGTNVATFLATPSSANLAAALTDETGSGATVFATSPTLVMPVLGTPASGTLTNCTGLPLSGLTFVGFKGSRSATQTITTSTNTKVQLNIEDFDTRGEFDPTTNYRHTPLIAGRWMYIGVTSLSSLGDGKSLKAMIYKNGAADTEARESVGASTNIFQQVTTVISMNGTTDYVELYVWHDHGSDRDTQGVASVNWLIGIYLGA